MGKLETRQSCVAVEESGLFNSSNYTIITEQHHGCHTLLRLNMTLSQSLFLFLFFIRTFSIFSFAFIFHVLSFSCVYFTVTPACFHTFPIFPLMNWIGILIVFLISYSTSLWTWHFSCFVIHYQWAMLLSWIPWWTWLCRGPCVPVDIIVGSKTIIPVRYWLRTDV